MCPNNPFLPTKTGFQNRAFLLVIWLKGLNWWTHQRTYMSSLICEVHNLYVDNGIIFKIEISNMELLEPQTLNFTKEIRIETFFEGGARAR